MYGMCELIEHHLQVGVPAWRVGCALRERMRGTRGARAMARTHSLDAMLTAMLDAIVKCRHRREKQVQTTPRLLPRRLPVVAATPRGAKLSSPKWETCMKPASFPRKIVAPLPAPPHLSFTV